MKKAISLLLILVLASLLVLPVSAATPLQAEIKADRTEVKPGDTVKFAVSISGTTEYTTLGLKWQFDTDVFELVTGECVAEDALLSSYKPETGFAVLYQTAGVHEGEVGTFTLKVKDAAPAGAAEVSFITSGKKGPADIPVGINAVKITVVGGTQEQTEATQSSESAVPSGDASEPSQAATAPSQGTTVPSNEAETVDKQALEAQTAATQPTSVETIGAAQKPNSDLPWLIGGGVLVGVLLLAVVVLFIMKKKREQ